MALFVTLTASAVSGISSMGFFWLFWPLITMALMLDLWACRALERLLRFQLVWLRLGVAVAVFGLSTFALAELHNDDQRCVSQPSMIVVPAADCQNAGSQVSTATDVWYYGGTGTGIGQSVQGGSLNPPSDDDGGSGGGGSVSGDDGGDDGGGGDGGGGDG